MNARVKYELKLAAVMLFIGLVPVPVAVYFVGQAVVGPYEGASGLFGLIGQIGSDLAQARLAAWILVLSPYAIVQLLRAATHRRRRPQMM
jgi:hypothetical protein